jgi:hypothetical protein
MKTATAFITALLFVFSIVSTASSYQLTFTPRASTSLEYTDNLFLSEKNKEDEIITVVSVGFTLSLSEKNMGLEISYDPSYAFYNDFDENDSWRHNARVFAWSDLGKNTRLEITDRFLFTEDPLGEEDLVRDDQVIIPGDTTIRKSRNQYYTNTAIARLNHRFGVNNLLYAEFLQSFLRNDDPDTEDNDRYQPSVGLTYWFGQRYGLETRGSYTRGIYSQDSDFQGTPTDNFDNWFGSLKGIRNISRNFSLYAQYDHAYRNYDGNFDNDYHLYSPSAGFQYSPEKDLRFALGLGYFYQDIDGADNQDGLFGSGEIRKSWNYRRGAISLSGSAGLDQNDFGAQRLGVERFVSLRADAQYGFTRELSGNMFGNFHYSDPVNTDESDGIEDQKRYSAGAGFTYIPLRWMTLNLNYRYTKYESDQDRNVGSGSRDNYDENRVMFMITFQPDLPWRYSDI